MGTTATSESGVQVLRIDGDLVAATAPEFRRTAEKLLALDERDYVVDLADARSVDSAGLEALTWLARSCAEKLGSMCVCHAGPTMRTIFNMTRLDTRFEMFDATEDAIASFG